MCGIYVTNLPFSKDEIIDKLKKINYRGPDNIGYNKIKNLQFGHVRLAIMDLEKRSNQPMLYNDNLIVYNGEIYNYKDIKEELVELGYDFNTTSDTEVILAGYDKWGKNILNKLNGMYSFVIYNQKSRKLFCVRDRLGVKPFYYYWDESKFEICSQIGPLINKNNIVSKDALSIYYDCGYIPSPLSIISGIKKLPPGNYMIIDLKKKNIIIKEYWNLKKIKNNKLNYKKVKERLNILISDAVKIRLDSDVEIGSFLSGGIDSALISVIAAKNYNNKLNTFTIGFNDPNYDESKIAKNISKIIGSNHTQTILEPEDVLNLIPKLVEVYDEPFADTSALPSLLLNHVTKKKFTVALSGDGGDESFLGYTHFDILRKFNYARLIPYRIRKLLALIPWHLLLRTRPDTIKGILISKDCDELSEKIFTGFDTLQLNKVNTWLDHYSIFKKLAKDPIQRMADLNIKLWLENDSNVKVDRASMASSVEVRSPFLDYRIVEFARSIPISFRYTKNAKKKILRDLLNDYIPIENFDNKKRGFTLPLGKWIRKELKEEIIKELNDEFLTSLPNFNTEKFKSQLEAHLLNKYDYTNSIWRLFLLSKWYKYHFNYLK